MLESASTYDKKLWAEAMLTSVYIKNRQPHSALKDLTPYKAFMASSHRSSTFNLSAENAISMYRIRNERMENSGLRRHKGLFLPDTPLFTIIIECSYLILKRL